MPRNHPSITRSSLAGFPIFLDVKPSVIWRSNGCGEFTIILQLDISLATRIVKGMRELPYEDRPRRLNIFSLERRQLRGDLILAYNIYHGRLDLPQAEFLEAPAERDLRLHDFKLRHGSFRLLRSKAAFSVRFPISWNKPSMEMPNSFTLDTFKRLLHFAWFSPFPSLPWLQCSFDLNFTWIEVPLFFTNRSDLI